MSLSARGTLWFVGICSRSTRALVNGGAASRRLSAGKRSAALARNFATEQPEVGCRFNESHEWVSLDKDVATVGITDYAQENIGDVAYVELPEVGKDLSISDSFGVIESVKSASELYAPLSGTVAETNQDLEGDPGLVNHHPYTKGWLVKLRVADSSEYDALLSYDDYMKFVKEAS